MKPHGTLVISTPYHGYLKNVAVFLLDHWDKHHAPQRIGGHIKFWSKKTLTGMLQDNGFRVTRIAGVGRVPFIWKSMIVDAELV